MCSKNIQCAKVCPAREARYSAVDCATWSTLRRVLEPLNEILACHHYNMYSPVVLGHDTDRVPTQDELSAKLYAAVGWKIACADGLVPAREFFEKLASKEFPATDFLRDPSHPLFSAAPDGAHEALGHVGMLPVPKVADFYADFGRIALKHVDNVEKLLQITRLYWFTNEVGLVREVNQVKVFGGAILSSVHEMVTFSSVKHHPFEPAMIAQTAYNDSEPQPILFVADSVAHLIIATLDYLNTL